MELIVLLALFPGAGSRLWREQMPPLQRADGDSKVCTGLLGRKARVPLFQAQTLLSYPAPPPQSMEHLAPATRDPISCHKPNAWLLALFIAAVGIFCCVINFLTKKAVHIPARLEKWRQILPSHSFLSPPLSLQCYDLWVRFWGSYSEWLSYPLWVSVCSPGRWGVRSLFTNTLFSLYFFPESRTSHTPTTTPASWSLPPDILNLKTKKRVGSEKPHSGFSSIKASNYVGIISLIVSTRQSLS